MSDKDLHRPALTSAVIAQLDLILAAQILDQHAMHKENMQQASYQLQHLGHWSIYILVFVRYTGTPNIGILVSA